MKTYKQIDFWGSLFLITAALVSLMFDFVIAYGIGYFVLGAWQFVSFIVHLFLKQFKDIYRFSYNIAIIIILILFIISAIYINYNQYSNFIFFILYAMLIVSPILATLYTIICYHEAYGAKSLK